MFENAALLFIAIAYAQLEYFPRASLFYRQFPQFTPFTFNYGHQTVKIHH